MYQTSATQGQEYDWEEAYARIVRERGHMLFFQRLFGAHGVQSLVLVSPWIGVLCRERFGYSLEDVAQLIVSFRIPTYVVTRGPEVAPTNEQAVGILTRCPPVNLFFNNDLHAKIYVCRCEPFGFALLSSANLSAAAANTVEIGLMIDGKGYGQLVVEELENVGKEDLPNMAGTRVVKYAERFVDRM